ncbi:SYCY2 protein [Scomber scombrus]|uniref:SYCY2 protein n=1 Tax=Scomber scombrus TaxID=13677 RepID=A0AAV1NGG3_SCOSC
MGFLKHEQCRMMLDHVSDYSMLSIMGIAITPGFHWCCGTNVWNSLPPLFKGRCALCTLNDVIYIAEPVEFFPNHTGSQRYKRDASELAEYIHLKNNNPVDLAKQYYALPFDHQIYTHSQLVFKTIFWNTELQYANHYLIALTRHDLALVANATFHGLQSISNELALIRQFVIDNRVALDAGTATQGGVCAIVGEGCCTYLPSESEGLGNLTIAIRNLRGIQEGIVRTNKDARVTGGYLDQQPWDNISRFFGGHPTIAWILSIFAPIIGIVLIVIVLMGCCFPIFRALILKSLHSVTNMTLIQNPVRNVTIYAPSEADSSDSTSITSTSSEESHGDD